MGDEQLDRTLKSVGMSCFVKYYEHADDPALAQRIRDTDRRYSQKSCQTRSSHIRSIVVKHRRGHDALAIIRDSDRVAPETRRKAAELLTQF